LTSLAWVVTEVVTIGISSVSKAGWAARSTSSVADESLISSARVVTEYAGSLGNSLPDCWTCCCAGTVCVDRLTSLAWVVTEVVTICISSVPERVRALRDASSVVDESLIGSARIVTELAASFSDGLPDCWTCCCAGTICVDRLTGLAWVVTEVVAICISSVSKANWAAISACSVVDKGLIGSARIVTELVASLND